MSHPYIGDVLTPWKYEINPKNAKMSSFTMNKKEIFKFVTWSLIS